MAGPGGRLAAANGTRTCHAPAERREDSRQYKRREAGCHDRSVPKRAQPVLPTPILSVNRQSSREAEHFWDEGKLDNHTTEEWPRRSILRHCGRQWRESSGQADEHEHGTSAKLQ